MRNLRRNLGRIKETVAEMNYAQRRVVEIKIAIPPEELRYSRTGRHQIEELEALYALESATVESENPV